MENPFQSPAQETVTLAEQPTIRIDSFPVHASGFQCSLISAGELEGQLREELSRLCQELGFRITEGEADYRIIGAFPVVQEGNRALRYLLSGLVGAVVVEVIGDVSGGQEETRAFRFRASKRFGMFGGDSQAMLKQSIAYLALKITKEAGIVGKRIDPMQTSTAWAYMRIVLLVAVIAAAIGGVARYGMGTVGVDLDDAIMVRALVMSAFFAFGLFGGISILGLAAAPGGVLKSHSMMRLRTISGVSSILALRLLLGVFGALFAGLAVLMLVEI